jgi:UrcA family protein
MNKIVFAFAALAMTGVTTTMATSPALAGNHSVTIDASAYNLQSASGYAALANRIDRAATQVCGAVDARDLVGTSNARACQEVATEDGLRQLNSISRNATVTVGASR